MKQLQQRRRISDNQIYRLNEQRQSIIDKNLAGVYSDDVFKEQFGIVDGQLKSTLILKDSLLFDGYTIDAIRNYVKSNLDNLPYAFEKLDVKQKRTLIGLIFPRGLVWNYPGLEIKS